MDLTLYSLSQHVCSALLRALDSLKIEGIEGAVVLWSNPAGSWCQKLSEVGVLAPATVASLSGFEAFEVLISLPTTDILVTDAK